MVHFEGIIQNGYAGLLSMQYYQMEFMVFSTGTWSKIHKGVTTVGTSRPFVCDGPLCVSGWAISDIRAEVKIQHCGKTVTTIVKPVRYFGGGWIGTDCGGYPCTSVDAWNADVLGIATFEC